MAFIAGNFTPTGANARSGEVVSLPDPAPKGNANAIFKYTSQDNLSEIIAEGYFNEIRGILKIGDWIYIDKDVDNVVGHSIYFVGRDGSELSGIQSVVVSDGGTGYNVGDLVSITYTDGAVIRNSIARVTTVAANVVTGIEVADPGTFSDNPTTLVDLATVALTGTGNDDLEVDVVLETVFGDIWLAPKSMVAS